MKSFLVILIFFFLQNCTKPKTVLICGDHVCINNSEAEQYFEENLSIEVKIINRKGIENVDLIRLNLKDSSENSKKINIERNIEANEQVKVLSNDEIKKIKKEIKEKEQDKKNNKKVIYKNIKNDKDKKKIIKKITKTKNIDSPKKTIIDVNKQRKEVVDICTIIQKCSIDEISKYLLEEGKKKRFPDITTKK
ncbi:hypothetical protein OAL84_01220 [Pelagibacteraceae bacterium]|nr:hypothetical protein [Pelagibacteraceae bacterium]